MGVFSIFPSRASVAAGEVDALYTFLLVVGGAMTMLIFASVFFFAVRYRRKSPDDPAPKAIHGSLPLEVAWSCGSVPGDAGDVWLGNQAVFSKLHATRSRHAGHLYYRQTMDVESAVPDRAARN